MLWIWGKFRGAHNLPVSLSPCFLHWRMRYDSPYEERQTAPVRSEGESPSSVCLSDNILTKPWIPVLEQRGRGRLLHALSETARARGNVAVRTCVSSVICRRASPYTHRVPLGGFPVWRAQAPWPVQRRRLAAFWVSVSLVVAEHGDSLIGDGGMFCSLFMGSM